MKRRGFFKALAGAIGVGVAIKALPKEEPYETRPKYRGQLHERPVSPEESFFGVDRSMTPESLKGIRYTPDTCLVNADSFDRLAKTMRGRKI